MWKDLTLRQRALLILMGVRAGIGSANTIRKLYDLQNTFATGGVKPKILVSGTFADSETGDYRHPIEAARQKLFPYYKDYVASLNKSGDPLDDAALYYNFHQMMLDAFDDLERAYGNKFNDMTDMLQAALLSAYFQGKKEGRNIVGKGSPFYYSYIQGNPIYDYIKAPTGPENALRKMWWEYNDTHPFTVDKEGYNRFGEAMSFNLPEAVIEAPKKTTPTTPTPPIDWEYNEEVVGMPPLQEKQKEENEKPILKKVVRERMPGFDPEALYTNFGDKDNHRYKTFKYELDPDKVIMDNKALELKNLETVGFLQRMLDIYSPVEDEFYVNPMLHANGGNLLAYGGDEPDWSKLYKGVLYNTDLNSIDKDPLYSIDSTGKVVYPQYDEWSNGNPRDAVAPAYMSADYSTPQTFGLIYDNLKSIYDLYNARIDAENRRKNPKLIDYYLNHARTDIGLRPIGMGSEYTDGIERAIRDYIPYSFNKGVEVLTLPLKLAIDGMLAQPNSVGGTSYSASNPNLYTVYTEPNPEVSNNTNTLMSYTMPSTWAKKLLPDEAVDLLNNTEWGNAATNAFDLYTLSKAPKIIKETPKAVDYVMAKTGNKPAAARYVARNFDNIVNTSVPESGNKIDPSKVRFKLGDIEMNDPNLMYHLDKGDHVGAFSLNGAFIDNGKLIPGKSKTPNLESYSWWNLGKPYAIGVGENTFTRLVTAHKDSPNFIHVRSQNYPIGLWNGNKGFVLNSEYVAKLPIDVSNNIYHWDPTYGYRRVQNMPSTYDMNEGSTIRKNMSAGDDVIEIPEEETTSVNLNKPDYSLGSVKNLFDPFIRNAASDYLTKGTPAPSYLYGVGSDWVRIFHENLPKETIEEFNAFTKPRMKKYRTNENFDTEFDKSLEGGYVEGNKAAFRDVNKGKKANIDAFYRYADDAVVVPERGTLDWANDIGHEVRHRIDSKIPLTEEERTILYDAYDEDFNLLGLNLFEEGETYDIKQEAVTTNRDARKVVLGNNYHLSLEELNARIRALPDKSVFEAVRKANGYGRRYIEKLEKEGKLTPKKAQQLRDAMIKVGAYTIPTAIGTIFGMDNEKAYGGNLFANGSRLKSPIDPPTNPWGVSYKPSSNYDVKYNEDNTVEPLWFYDWAPEGTNRDTVAPGYMFENGVNEHNATLGNLYNEYWDKTQAYNREINKLNHPELFWDTYHDAAVRLALNGSASDIFNGAIKGLLNIASAPIELYKGFAIPGYTPYNLFGNNHPMVSLVSDVIDKGVGGAFSIVNPLSYIDWGSAGMEGSHVKLPWNPNSNGVETPAVIDAAGFIAMPYVAKGLGKAGKYVKNKYTDWFDPYTSFNANFGYYGNPMQRFWGTIARRFNLPDRARLPEVLRKQDGDVRPMWSGRKPGHVNMTIDRGVVPHSNGTWLERNLYITDPTTVFNKETIPFLKSIEPSDVFVDGMPKLGIALDPSKTTIVSGDVVSLELAKLLGMSTLSSKRARELYEKAKELDAAAAAAEEERNPTSRFSFEKPKYKDVVSFANNYWVEYAKELQRLQSRRGTPTLKDIKALEDMTGLEAHVKPIEEFSLFKDNVLKWFNNPSKYERPTYPNGNPVTGKMWILKSILDGSDFPYNKIFYDRSSPIEFNTPGAWLGGVRQKANGGKLI